MPVTITRTPWIDDDGSGTTGTVVNNAVKTELYSQIDQGFVKLSGDPIDHPFNAADYSAVAPMTWTVAGGQVATNCYSIANKLVVWTLVITNSTLGGSATYEMKIQLPTGLSSSRDIRGGIGNLQIGPAAIPAQFIIAPAATTMSILRADVTPFPLGTLHLLTTITFWKV